MVKKKIICIVSSIVITSFLYVTFFLIISSYAVEKYEVGIITRNGRYHKTVGPGNYILYPFIDKMEIYQKHINFAEDFGYRVEINAQETKYIPEKDESYFITADLMIIHIEWQLRYNITDHAVYHYAVQNQKEVLRTLSYSIFSKLTGEYLFDELNTIKKNELQYTAIALINKELESLNTGVKVIDLVLKNVNPPDDTRNAFNDILIAGQEKKMYIEKKRRQYLDDMNKRTEKK